MGEEFIEDYNDFDIDKEDTNSYSSSPQDNTSYDVFFLRNNPEPLIEEFYLFLTNKIKNNDPINNAKKPYIRLTGTKSLLNEQGVRDLVQYMRVFINNHTVQTNINSAGLNKFMRDSSDETWTFIVNSLDEWGLNERYALGIKNMLISKVELFLRRGLDDKEREHYSIEQKHDYSHVSGDSNKKKRLRIPETVSNMFRG